MLKVNLNKQYSRRIKDNCIHGIPDHFLDDELEGKIVKNVDQIDGKINANDTEDCHYMVKSNKGTIMRFFNRNNYKAVLDKKV